MSLRHNRHDDSLFDLDFEEPDKQLASPPALRDYQQAAVDALRRSVAAGKRAPVLVAPCGSGKTIMARAIVEGAIEKNRNVLFLAPRRELIYQTSAKLSEAGIHHGVMMAGEGRRPGAQVQVASLPTLHRRLADGHAQRPPASVVLVDECHLALAKTTMDVLAGYPDAIKIGLTATPCRGDGRGLGEMFDDLVLGPSIPELTALGFLVPTRYFAPSTPDLEGVGIKMGDYNQKQLGERMDDPVLIGDVIDNWRRIAGELQTVVFAVNVAHSMHLRDEFERAGVAAEHLDASTPKDERRGILQRFEAGQTQVICNCQIFSYGIDCPPAAACVLAHPTKSLARYHQAVGRVLRPYPGKAECLVIDHAGIVAELGFVADPQPWSLDGKRKIQDAKSSTARKEPKPLTCPQCSTVFAGAGICPACGHDMATRYAAAVEAIEAELQELTRLEDAAAVKRAKKARDDEWPSARKERFYQELLGLAIERGYKEGWAYHKYIERFEVGPPWAKQTREPSLSTRSWVKSRQIAWAKSKHNEARRA